MTISCLEIYGIIWEQFADFAQHIFVFIFSKHLFLVKCYFGMCSVYCTYIFCLFYNHLILISESEIIIIFYLFIQANKAKNPSISA